MFFHIQDLGDSVCDPVRQIGFLKGIVYVVQV